MSARNIATKLEILSYIERERPYQGDVWARKIAAVIDGAQERELVLIQVWAGMPLYVTVDGSSPDFPTASRLAEKLNVVRRVLSHMDSFPT